MSILDSIRKKYGTAIHSTDKTDKRAFVSSVSPTHKHIENISRASLRLIAGSEWPVIQADPDQLAAFKAAAETAAHVQQGIVPAHYSATAVCRHCGPVPIFPGLPASVDGCPWCLARVQGRPVPRLQRRPHDDA